MNEETFCPSLVFGAIPQSGSWLTVRTVAAVLLATALMDITGFARNKPAQKSDSPAAIGAPVPQPPPELNRLGRALPAEAQLLEGSGIAVWAKEFPGQLFGLDGALYEAYRQAIIKRVQEALRDRGLYGGPVNGILDRPTMKSIYAFQEANNLQRCGVPTPHTRKMLHQGSHTDLTF